MVEDSKSNSISRNTITKGDTKKCNNITKNKKGIMSIKEIEKGVFCAKRKCEVWRVKKPLLFYITNNHVRTSTIINTRKTRKFGKARASENIRKRKARCCHIMTKSLRRS